MPKADDEMDLRIMPMLCQRCHGWMRRPTGHLVRCGHGVRGEELHNAGVFWVHSGVPAWCPYILEHVVLNNPD